MAPYKSLSVRIFHQLSAINYQHPIAVVTNYDFNHAHGKLPK